MKTFAKLEKTKYGYKATKYNCVMQCLYNICRFLRINAKETLFVTTCVMFAAGIYLAQKITEIVAQ